MDFMKVFVHVLRFNSRSREPVGKDGLEQVTLWDWLTY